MDETDPAYIAMKKAIEDHYKDMVLVGYKWETNRAANMAEKTAKEFRERGLDVFVGDWTVGAELKPLNGLKAILVKKKDNNQA